jgi:hypothetical protein
VALAIERDGGSGGVARIGVITKAGARRSVYAPETPGALPTWPEPKSYTLAQ